MVTNKIMYSAAGGAALVLFMLGRLSVSAPDHDEECKIEIAMNHTMANQIAELEKQLIDSRLGGCEKLGNNQCDEKVKKLKETYKKLKCRICESAK